MITRKVALFMMVSLDGFFEGPNHELAFGERVADLPKTRGESRLATATPENALQPTAPRTNLYSPGRQNVLK
jgi:hypothetical protein